MDVNAIYTFKVLDNLMDEHQKNPDLFAQLFEKKKKLLEKVESKQLDAGKYAKLTKKMFNQATNEEIKGMIDMELLMLTEGEEEDWFKDVIDDTKEQLEQQSKQYKKFGQKEPGSISKPQPKPNTSTKTDPKPMPSTQIPIETIFSLKLLDEIMDQNKDKAIFMRCFEQKKKLVDLMIQGKINAKVYYQGLKKSYQKFQNEDWKFTVTIQLEQVQGMHQGNMESWFKDVVSQSGDLHENQEKKYNAYKTGKKVVNSKKEDDDEILKEANQIAGSMRKKIGGSSLQDSELFCFRYFDEQMEANEGNQQEFCKIFEKKLAVIEKLKQGLISAQDYRQQLNEIIQNSQNEDLKSAAQMETDLHDLGDINEFFKSVIDETGANYQKQEQIYNKFKGKKPVQESNPKKPVEKSSLGNMDESERPPIADIISFRALNKLLNEYQKDFEYCIELKEKGGKLMKLVDAKKLGSNQYLLMLQKKLPDITHPFLIRTMNEQIRALNQGNSAQLFKKLVSEYIDQTKLKIGMRSSYQSKMEINEDTINDSSSRIKVEFLLRKLSRYESLFAFYKNNHLNELAQKLNPIYSQMKKAVLLEVQKIAGDASDRDLKQFARQNIPEISFQILHHRSRDSFDQKIDEFIHLLQNSSKSYDEYTKKLKKGTNKENLQTVAKAKQKYKQNIQYLNSLKKSDFIPLPIFQEVKKQMYNMDLNKLDENQIQIIITNIQGIPKSTIFKLYLIDFKNHRQKIHVTQGEQNINLKYKIPQGIMAQIIKGTDKNYLSFKLMEKGWITTSNIDEVAIDLNFINNNTIEDRVSMKEGQITISYILKVQKPKRPRITEITTYEMKKIPEYKHDKFIQAEFLKKMMPFENPTKSEVSH